MIDTSAETVGRYVTEARAIGRAHYADMFLALLTERDEATKACRLALKEVSDTARDAGSWQGLAEGKDVVIRQLEAERDTVTADWKAEIEMHREEHRRRMRAEAERNRLWNLLFLAEGKLSEGRLYIGYSNEGPLNDYATASIIQRARAALKETKDG
jgi:hypothetical protein